MRDITMPPGAHTRGVQFGPRVERDGHVEPPASGEAPQFWGVYVAGMRGGWNWYTDARDEESARAIAGLLRRAHDLADAQRVQADDLTLAYVAKGAGSALIEGNHGQTSYEWEGEDNFIAEVIAHAVTLDRVGDYFNEEGHPGVFVYDVAEEFGARYANALLADKDANAAEIVREVFRDAEYPPEELAEAFRGAGILD